MIRVFTMNEQSIVEVNEANDKQFYDPQKQNKLKLNKIVNTP